MQFCAKYAISVFLLTQPLAYAVTPGVYIKDVRWQTQDLKVCWQEPGHEKSKAIVRDIVKNEYARAGFSFGGWKDCQSTDLPQEVIRITLLDKRPEAHYGCKKANPWCVTLNFHFRDWPYGKDADRKCKGANRDISWACYCRDKEYQQTCIQSYALHEFGHVLGLAHEMMHTDNLENLYCDEVTYRDSGAIDVGEYDPDSVMNYCKNKDQIIDNYLPTLSDGDIFTLKKIYEDPESIP